MFAILMTSTSVAPYYGAMIAVWVLAVLYFLFRPKVRYPVQDHSWLRHQPGTWIKHRTTLEVNGVASEELLTAKLQEIRGHQYVLEETITSPGAEPRSILSITENSINAGWEPVKVSGQHYQCTVWLAFSRRGGASGLIRSFVPEGEKEPVGIVFKSPAMRGELMAVARDERVEAMGRTYSCTRLEGKVRQGDASGAMTLWHCRDLPGSQVRMDLALQGPKGFLRSRTEVVELHVEVSPQSNPAAPAPPLAGPG